MGFYGRVVLPRIVHLTCATRPVMRQRRKVVPLAHGRVLEVGIGSGLNLACYDGERVTRVWGLDPSPEMLRMAEKAATGVRFDVELIPSPAEELPLEDDSADTVVTTFSLCSTQAIETALRQMSRVLRPGGKLLFCEHGASPDAAVRRWQDRVDPLWTRLAGGCHLNRAIPQLIEAAGFSIESLETGYLPGWRPASFTYRGVAAGAP